MSLNAVKKHNLPGLASGSFGSRSTGVNTKTSGVSSQAAKNLKGASAATSANSVFNGMFKKSSSFNRVAGQNTLKGRNQANLSRRRASLGNNGVSRSIPASVPTYVAAMPAGYGAPKMSGLEKALMYASVGIKAFQMGAELFGGGVTNGQQIDAAMGSLGGATGTPQLASTVGQSSIASMQNAQTSGELSAAISGAEGQLAQMQQTAASGNFEAKATTAQNNMDTYKDDVNETKDGVKDAQQEVKTADGAVSSATSNRDSKLLALKNADAQYGAAVEANIQAKDAVSQATQNLATAEATLNATPQTITDASGNQVHNPAYDKAKAAVETAKKEKQAAEAKQEQTQQAEDKADASRDKANTAANTAKENLDKAQDTLETQKKKQTTAQTNLIKAEDKFRQAQEIYQEAQEAVQKFQDYQHDIKELQGEIEDQKERLEKMKEKEDKKLDKLSKKIDKRTAKNDRAYAKIDSSDGMNLIEKMRSNAIDRRNNKSARDLAKKEAIINGQNVPS